MSAPTIGLARLPRGIRDLLAQAAGTVNAAAAALVTLARDPGNRSSVTEIVALEDDGDRIAHELRHAAATARVAAHERSPLLKVSEAIDDILDAIESAAHEMAGAGDALPDEELLRATAVVRDLARTAMATVVRLEDPPTAREALHERAHELEDELRADLRAMHASVANAGDVLVAIRAADVLRGLRSVGEACAQALLAFEVLAGVHV